MLRLYYIILLTSTALNAAAAAPKSPSAQVRAAGESSIGQTKDIMTFDPDDGDVGENLDGLPPDAVPNGDGGQSGFPNYSGNNAETTTEAQKPTKPHVSTTPRHPNRPFMNHRPHNHHRLVDRIKNVIDTVRETKQRIKNSLFQLVGNW